MGALVSLFGALLLLSLTLSGLLLIVVPPLGRRMLHKTTVFAGGFVLFLFALNVFWQMVPSINPLLLILGVAALSSLAYFVRERRLGNSRRRDGTLRSERSPVMPQHTAGDDE
jgi:hypothetical protein